MTPVLVGVLDGGIADELAPAVAVARGFALDDAGEVVRVDGPGEAADHATAIARTILAAAPSARLVSARVFDRSLAAAPAVVAAALDWLVAEGVAIANLSFGLHADREVLRRACAAALARGVLLVAASPARGPAVFPAAYPGVLRVCGDARCAPGEVSDLGGEPADFGACPRAVGAPVAGASAAAAQVSGIVAAWLAARGGATATGEEVRARLVTVARFRGRERRGPRPAESRAP